MMFVEQCKNVPTPRVGVNHLPFGSAERANGLRHEDFPEL